MGGVEGDGGGRRGAVRRAPCPQHKYGAKRWGRLADVSGRLGWAGRYVAVARKLPAASQFKLLEQVVFATTIPSVWRTLSSCIAYYNRRIKSLIAAGAGGHEGPGGEEVPARRLHRREGRGPCPPGAPTLESGGPPPNSVNYYSCSI